jgi:hypothetical protein
MDIVKTFDLVAAHLPNLESPFFAAEKARNLLENDRHGHRFNLNKILDQVASSGLRPDQRMRLINEVSNRLREGKLWLVYGPCGGKPFDPVVSWREDSSGQGRWMINDSACRFALGDAVQSLNENNITPQQLARQNGRSIGSLSVGLFSTELRLLRKEEALQRQSVASSDSPFPATPVAPLPSTTQTPQSSASETPPEVHLEIGLFTDGTLNNADNSRAMEDRVQEECLTPLEDGEITEAECRYRLAMMLGGSYANAPSNVAKLADLYTELDDVEENFIIHRIAHYAPGIGTRTGDKDSLIGMTSGGGETGIVSQVKQAFDEIAKRIYRLGLSAPLRSLTVDLFGFSRGAASSRHAAHEINLGVEGAFGRALNHYSIDWPEQVSIRFVGLFDTVAAVVNPLALDLSPGNDRNDPVNLYLDPHAVEQAVHLVASDEHRENFALNSLRNSDGSLPDNFREISLPGVHSDIGGGYSENMREDVLISPIERVSLSWFDQPEQTRQWQALEGLKKQKEAEGWIGAYSLPVRASEKPNPPPSGLGTESEARLAIHTNIFPQRTPHSGRMAELALRMVRQVRGEYSRVTLRIMHELAVRGGVPLEPIPNRQDFNLPLELRPVADQLMQESFGETDSPSLNASQQQMLRQRYIHYSSNFNSIQFSALGTPASLRLPNIVTPNAPAQSGERAMYPNSRE